MRPGYVPRLLLYRVHFGPGKSLNERAAEEAARFFPAIPSSPLSHLFPPLFPACIPVACPSGKGFVEIEGEREMEELFHRSFVPEFLRSSN